jgi:hypothetical protein
MLKSLLGIFIFIPILQTRKVRQEISHFPKVEWLTEEQNLDMNPGYKSSTFLLPFQNLSFVGLRKGKGGSRNSTLETGQLAYLRKLFVYKFAAIWVWDSHPEIGDRVWYCLLAKETHKQTPGPRTVTEPKPEFSLW